VAHHSDKPAADQELLDSDILIITHQAYVNSVGHSGAHKCSQRSRFVTWRGGSRLLTIVDEALANVVENNKVTVADLAQVIGYVPPEMRHELPEQVRVLDELHHILVARANPEGRTEAQPMSMFWDNDTPSVSLPDMSELHRAMKTLPYDVIVFGELNEKSRAQIWKKVRETLTKSEAVMAQWAFYAKKGNEHSINSASFLIPWDIPGPVVLDATASANFLWDLFGPRAQTVPTPTKVRNYSTVTLHVARAAGVGKTAMVPKIKPRFRRLLRALKGEVSPDRSVFVCMHKDAEHVIRRDALKQDALSGAQLFARFDIGHWGAVDGRNDWASCDTAVIFGLPYRDPVWSTSQFFALQGPQDDEWIKNPVWNEHADVRRVMEQRQMSVAIIQAVNRVCCRRVIDAQGRCPPADIFIILPKDKTGDAILKDIHADMPGLIEVPWAFKLDGETVKKVRKGTSHEALIAYMGERPSGDTPLSSVKRELELSPSKLKDLRAVLRDTAHHTTTALRDIGVQYIVRGAGRGSQAFLIKAQAV